MMDCCRRVRCEGWKDGKGCEVSGKNDTGEAQMQRGNGDV